jgi:hypothetical protein
MLESTSDHTGRGEGAGEGDGLDVGGTVDEGGEELDAVVSEAEKDDGFEVGRGEGFVTEFLQEGDELCEGSRYPYSGEGQGKKLEETEELKEEERGRKGSPHYPKETSATPPPYPSTATLSHPPTPSSHS